MALLGPWPFVEGMGLAPFFEEVYGTYSEYIGYLLERVRTAAALVLEPPHRTRRKPSPLR